MENRARDLGTGTMLYETTSWKVWALGVISVFHCWFVTEMWSYCGASAQVLTNAEPKANDRASQDLSPASSWYCTRMKTPTSPNKRKDVSHTWEYSSEKNGSDLRPSEIKPRTILLARKEELYSSILSETVKGWGWRDSSLGVWRCD